MTEGNFGVCVCVACVCVCVYGAALTSEELCFGESRHQTPFRALWSCDGQPVRDQILSALPSVWKDANTASPESGRGPSVAASRFLGQEVRRLHTGHKGGAGFRILSPPRIYECTHQCEHRNRKKKKKKEIYIYYEVNAYVNTLKTKSTRGQDIANQKSVHC